MKARRKPGPKRKRWHECKKCGAQYRNARRKLDHQRKCKDKYITIIEHREINDESDFLKLISTPGLKIEAKEKRGDNFLHGFTKTTECGGETMKDGGVDLNN